MHQIRFLLRLCLQLYNASHSLAGRRDRTGKTCKKPSKSPRTPPLSPSAQGFGPSCLAFTQYRHAQHPNLKIPSCEPEMRPRDQFDVELHRWKHIVPSNVENPSSSCVEWIQSPPVRLGKGPCFRAIEKYCQHKRGIYTNFSRLAKIPLIPDTFKAFHCSSSEYNTSDVFGYRVTVGRLDTAHVQCMWILVQDLRC